MLQSNGFEWAIVGGGLVLLLGFVFFFVFRKPKQLQQPQPPPQIAVVPVPEQLAPQTVSEVPKLTWLDRLRTGLGKTRLQLVKNLDELFSSSQSKLSRDETFEKIFEILISADVGYQTTSFLVEQLKSDLSVGDFEDSSKVRAHLQRLMSDMLVAGSVQDGSFFENSEALRVVLMVGVNGVGKTTTTGKLAFKASQHGLKVTIGAADTFRAAAVEQLAVWAERSHASFVKLNEGSDPASVAFESVRRSQTEGAQLCLIDTAGRLHNRADLMQELAKIRRSAAKECPGAPHEVLLVLDATTGQNAIQQARVFKEVVNVTGLVLTKLDGTAKGGVALAIAHELALPIRFIGVGEQVEDLEVFKPTEFVNALFQ